MFLEQAGTTIRMAENNWNFVWMSACYGTAAYAHAKKPISCSGFVIGRSEGMAK
jgi:hypothetical protein